MIKQTVSGVLLVGLVASLGGGSTACSSSTAESQGSAQASAWDAESADDETKSTHLWIVNRALDVLAQHAGESDAAARAVAELNVDACRTAWQQGLVDTDFKAKYNNGNFDLPIGANDAEIIASGASWKSHFFDVDTGKNYKGESSPTARTEANRFLDEAFAAGYDFGGSDAESDARSTACYSLGLSFHYFTDITQPMHATNFTAKDRPINLHGHLESYAMTIQARYPLADWSGAPSGSIDDFIVATAKGSKAQWVPGVQSVVNAYGRSHSSDPFLCGLLDANPAKVWDTQEFDHQSCWANDSEVDDTVGSSLKSAQDATAQYLFLVGKRMMGQ